MGFFRARTSPYDHQGDVYVCPGGKILTCKGTVVNDNQLLYRASKYDCDVCRLKPRCCGKEPGRKVPRSIHEGARDLARDTALDRRLLQLAAAAEESRGAVLRLDRLRLRGPCGARDEFLLTATAQNLRKLAKLITPPTPLPAT
jgi:Transposase DDE domain